MTRTELLNKLNIKLGDWNFKIYKDTIYVNNEKRILAKEELDMISNWQTDLNKLQEEERNLTGKFWSLKPMSAEAIELGKQQKENTKKLEEILK